LTNTKLYKQILIFQFALFLTTNCLLVKQLNGTESKANKSLEILLTFFGISSPATNTNNPITTYSDPQNWSDTSTWGSAGKPTSGQNITIPAGVHIILDENPPDLGGLIINGRLEFASKDLSLTARWIMVHGELLVGSESNPFTHNAIITLNGNDTSENTMNMGTRGIMVMGGKLELHGVAPDVTWTKINEHAVSGVTQLKLIQPVNWKVGDQIVIAPTDFYEAGANRTSVSQRISLSAVSGSDLTLTTGLNAFRFGLLQYPTSTGMSLSADNVVSPPVADTETKKTPTVLDERAEVGNLTRNIVIQSPEDSLWTNQGFGVHIMIMGTNATAHVEGIEIRRGGQRGRTARYPFHWHMLSYAGSQTLDDASGQYFRNSSINSSQNRGVVIHGTNGVTVRNNVIFDIKGHGIFTEDAVERRNTIDGNLVLHIRNSTQPLKNHEGGNGSSRGSSCFWISNPDNTITNNTAADCNTNGFWLAFTFQPWGESATVLDTRDGLLLNPSRLQFGTFDNNTAHSNGQEGIMIDNVETDTFGNTVPFQYWSTNNGRQPQWPFPTATRFTLSNYKVWKNIGNGIWDRAVWPDNYGVVSADNCGRFFAGSGADGIIERSLVVGTSLNHLMNGTDRPAEADFASGFNSSTPVGFATYHSSFDIKENIVVNFSPVANNRSGVFSMDDYYIRPVEKGMTRNKNNRIINSHPGVKLNALFNYYTLASALLDPDGLWGPAGNYFVYDTPFLTYGKTVHTVNPNISTAGGVSVSGPFYGFEGFVLHGVGDTLPQNQDYRDLWGITIRRLDPNNLNTVIGTWVVAQAQPGALLDHMRDFATSPSSTYELTFQNNGAEEIPTNFQMNVENMLTTSDLQVIGIRFTGQVNAQVAMRSYAISHLYTNSGINSYAELRDSAGETFWQDKPNNMVWVKIRGGRWRYWTSDPTVSTPTNDETLYQTTQLRIYAAN